MNLALIVLNSLCNVNEFSEVQKRTIQQGNPDTLYFRIVDQDVAQQSDASSTGVGINGQALVSSPLVVFLRHLPCSGASLVIKSTNIDPYKSFQRVATMPFPLDDRSIWSIPILATDRIEFNGLVGTLTDSINSFTYQATIQDLTFSSISPSRSLINVIYTGGATAGSEVVSLSGNAITIQIQNGVSTATQIAAAFNASQVVSLASVAVSGVGSNPQNTYTPAISLQSQNGTYTLQFLTDITSPVASGQFFC
jgi:hypothetical protein